MGITIPRQVLCPMCNKYFWAPEFAFHLMRVHGKSKRK